MPVALRSERVEAAEADGRAAARRHARLVAAENRKANPLTGVEANLREQAHAEPVCVRHVRNFDDGRDDEIATRGDVHPAVDARAKDLDRLETERQFGAVRIPDV